MSDYAYQAELELHDGSVVTLDLEERGWAEPKRLAQARAFTLVPKQYYSNLQVVLAQLASAIESQDPAGSLEAAAEERQAILSMIAAAGRNPLAPAMPLLRINIPTGAKPVFKSKVYGTAMLNSEGNIEGYQQDFRGYAVGWKKGRAQHLIWIFPGGHTEATHGNDDPTFGDVMAAKY